MPRSALVLGWSETEIAPPNRSSRRESRVQSHRNTAAHHCHQVWKWSGRLVQPTLPCTLTPSFAACSCRYSALLLERARCQQRVLFICPAPRPLVPTRTQKAHIFVEAANAQHLPRDSSSIGRFGNPHHSSSEVQGDHLNLACNAVLKTIQPPERPLRAQSNAPPLPPRPSQHRYGRRGPKSSMQRHVPMSSQRSLLQWWAVWIRRTALRWRLSPALVCFSRSVSAESNLLEQEYHYCAY